MAGKNRPSRRAVGTVVVLAAVSLVVAAPPAAAEVGVYADPSMATFVTVDQSNLLATLTLVNRSTAPDTAQSFTVTSIKLAPSCAARSATACTTPDPGVFELVPPALGRAGTACAGTAFTISAPDTAGTATFTPSAPILIGPPPSTCIIDFTVDVNRVPSIDARADIVGMQTWMVGFLTVTSGGDTHLSSSSVLITVAPDAGPPADFDGDAVSDIAVYRPSTGMWYVRRSTDLGTTATFWGAPGDIPAAGDFDGDGRADVAVFRPSTGTWFVRPSGDPVPVVSWGEDGDVPMPADYDGDGSTDIAVYRPSTGMWYARRSSDAGTTAIYWGAAGDLPVTGDFDDDGVADVAVFRPSTGWWFVRKSLGGTTVVNWGVSGDVPMPADYDGDGRTDVAVYRPSTGMWYARRSSDAGTTAIYWGASGDLPVTGDYDGDGRDDIAVFRPSTGVWFLRPAAGTMPPVHWGISGDVPIGPPPARS